MNAFPLVARALASSARSGAATSLRFLAGGGSMALVILTLLATDGDGGASGRWLFNALSWGAMAGLGLLAVFNTADAISRERREETLGLLFLTDLTGADVVLGKLAASGLTPMVCLLGLVPSLSIFVAFGGLSFGEFARTALALGVGTFQIMAVTLLVSSFSTRARAAVAAGLVFAVASFLTIGVAGMALGPAVRWVPLVWGGPWALWHGSAASYAMDWATYWIAIPGALGVGCLALWMACRALSRNWRDSFAPAAPPVIPTAGQPPERLGRGQWPETGVEALATLLWARAGVAGQDHLLLHFIVILLSAIFVVENPGEVAAWIFFIGAKFASLFSFASLGVQALHRERREGTLETLLATPMTPLEIAQGCSLGLRRVFFPGAVFWAAVDGSVMAACWWRGELEGLGVVGFSLASFWCAYFGLSWGSAWAGVTHEGVYGGLLAALFCAVGAPALIATWVGVGLFGGRGIGGWVVLFLASVVVNRVWISSVRHQAAKHGMAVMLRPWRQSAPVIESEWSPIDWQADPEPGSPGHSATRPGS